MCRTALTSAVCTSATIVAHIESVDPSPIGLAIYLPGLILATIAGPCSLVVSFLPVLVLTVVHAALSSYLMLGNKQALPT